LADPDGMEINPIYDLSGNFLGTDDRGIAGSAIIMDKKNFRQGMSHSEALSNNVGIYHPFFRLQSNAFLINIVYLYK
ncbi:MAG: hypothetical protein IIZ29_03295, partial [Schwartzia sp.]|nr:hypothetical protein [Schwartzia sp. (in: firmicutes)]